MTHASSGQLAEIGQKRFSAAAQKFPHRYYEGLFLVGPL
jgi:hypothetical protein